MTWLLDTNVVSEWVKPRPAAGAIEWLAAVDEDRVFLSVCTLAEIGFGIELLPAGRRRAALADWLEGDLLERFRGRVLPITNPVAAAWSRLSAASHKTGRALTVMDGLIAATASAHQLTIVTRNIRHFRGFELELLNPF